MSSRDPQHTCPVLRQVTQPSALILGSISHCTPDRYGTFKNTNAVYTSYTEEPKSISIYLIPQSQITATPSVIKKFCRILRGFPSKLTLGWKVCKAVSHSVFMLLVPFSGVHFTTSQSNSTS
ncbi:hypothetical protein AOLI_G00076160 [Acnodon oligacanthus]